jgi:hypothetical protein
MARNIYAKQIEDKNGYDIRCKYFKRIEGTQEYDIKPYGVFYAKEIQPEINNPVIINGKIKDRVLQTTIETLDFVDSLNADDKILYKGNVYRVNSISSTAISSQEFSSRPNKQTQIVLVR